MKFEDQPVGTYALLQFDNPGHNGATTDLGLFDSLRRATDAARKFAPVSRLRGDFHATLKRSDKREGVVVDARTYPIPLEAGPYQADTEFRLSDGRVVWLGDVDEAIRTWLDYGKTAATEPAALPKRSDPLADTTVELETMQERIEELADWAHGEGYTAIGHKLEEASGPLSSAAAASQQYLTGELKVRVLS